MNKNFLFKSNLKLMCIFFGLFLSCCFMLNAHADNVAEIVEKAEKSFDKAATRQEKYNIVSQKFDRQYIFTEEKLPHNFKDLNFGIWNVNVLALAIAGARYELTEKFLEVVDDINSDALWVRGYKQDYTIAHVALDPKIFNCNNEDYDNRFKIFQLLAKKNIDFTIMSDMVPEVDLYKYPALTVAILSGYTSAEQIQTLQALAFLNGAYPIQEDLKADLNLDDFSNHKSTLFKIMLKFGNVYGYDYLHPDVNDVFFDGFSKNLDSFMKPHIQ